MYDKETLLGFYNGEKARFKAADDRAFFMVNLLGLIGESAITGEDRFAITCKGLHDMMDEVAAAFGNALSYLKNAVQLLEGDGQEEAGKEEEETPTDQSNKGQ